MNLSGTTSIVICSIAVWFTTCFLAIATSVYGQGNQSSPEDTVRQTIFLNDEIVIVAQRMGNVLFDRPEAISVLTGKDLRALSPMTMPDVLAVMPGVWMQKTNHGGGSAFIRGLTGYQTLIMIDGIRFNNSTFRSGPNQYLNTIDPLMIDKVEVLRGGGSVQYGSDAIGGTIYLETRDPVFNKEGTKLSGSVYGKYWSQNMEKTGRVAGEVSGKRSAVRIGLTVKSLGDIIAGGNLGKEHPTGYNDWSADLKWKQKVGQRHELISSIQHHRQTEVPLYHKIVSGEYSLYQFNPQQRDLDYIRLNSRYDNRWFDKISYTVSYQRSEEVREKMKTGSSDLTNERDVVQTGGVAVKVNSNITGNWEAVSGIEIYNDWIGSQKTIIREDNDVETGLRGLYPDGSAYTSAAIYTLHSWMWSHWNLFAGLRYNRFWIYVPDPVFGDVRVDPGALVGNLGIVYKFNLHHQFSFSANTGFRAPNINDMSSFGIADFRYEVPSYNLSPERSLNLELAYKFRGPWYSGALHLFENGLKDLITNVPGEWMGRDSLENYPVYQRENVEKARIWGVEAEGSVSTGEDLSWEIQMAYVYGRNISKDEPLRRIPPFNGRLFGIYRIIKNLKIKGEWVFAGAQTRLSPGDIADDRIQDGGTPGWNVLNFYVYYDIRFVKLSASFQNITNEAYRMHGSGIDGIGRSGWISVMFDL